MDRNFSDISQTYNEFQKIDRSAVSQQVVDQVKELIMNQKYLAGDKLPPERVMAELLGVGRPAIREALKILEAVGIVEIRHGSGSYLKEANFDFATFPMTIMLSNEKEIINELIEAREIVELEIISLAVRRADEGDIKRLGDFVEMRKSTDEIVRLEGKYDYDFEAILGEIAKNRILLSIQKATHALWEISLRKIKVQPLPVHVINCEHQEIFEAIRAGDEKTAREAMTYHLRALLRTLPSGSK